MKKFFMISDWWTHILVGATPEEPNLDSPTNVATLRRIASRYDVIVIVDPSWHTVGSRARDRIRQYATEQGRTVTLLRYMGSMYVQWHDQAGDMTLIPGQGRVSYDGVVSNSDTMLKSGGDPILNRGGICYLADPGSAAAVAAAKSNALTKAAGWDGILIDEVVDYPRGFQANPNLVPDGYPASPNLTYPNAKRDFTAAVTEHLVANGKTVAANITPYALPGSSVSYAQDVCDAAPGLLYPYLEAEFGADWGRARIGAASGSWATQQTIASFLTWCESNGRRPIPNVYSNDAGVLGYGLGLFLAYSGTGALWSGHCPEENENEEYMREPTWLPDYAVADGLGAPSGPAQGANVITRKYAAGRVAVNPSAAAQTLTVDGYYGAAGQPRTVGDRSLPALTAQVLSGDDFGTYRQVNGKKGAGHYMWGGGRWNRLVTPNAYTGPALPGGTILVSEAFTGADGSAWPSTWAQGMALSGSSATIVGNRGQLKSGTTAPGVHTRRFTGATAADVHLLARFTVASSQSLTFMFRSGDATLDEDSAYGMRLWDWQQELIAFDASYTGTQIGVSGKGLAAGVTYWVRLKAIGSLIQARTWADGDTEPGTWDIDVTNTAITAAGHFGWSVAGYGTAGASSVATVDDVTIGTA